jgi:hypothetical protein
VLKRFVVASFAGVGLIVPTTLQLAMLAALARPASPAQGCERALAGAQTSVGAMQARVKSLGSAAGPAVCNATRLYFFEVVKARAIIGLCKDGAERERKLGRVDTDVPHINAAIAAHCS